MGESIRLCRVAVENHHAKRIAFTTCRIEVATALDTLHDVFVQLRDKSTVTARVEQPGQLASGGRAAGQNGFLNTGYTPEKQGESDTSSTSLDEEQPASQQTTAQAAETAERQAPEPEDWKGKYEETNTLLEKTQALLVQTKADFTTQLENLERTLADEQKAVQSAQDEKEAAANKAKEDFRQKAVEHSGVGGAGTHTHGGEVGT